jgi:hypothetical protein
VLLQYLSGPRGALMCWAAWQLSGMSAQLPDSCQQGKKAHQGGFSVSGPKEVALQYMIQSGSLARSRLPTSAATS